MSTTFPIPKRASTDFMGTSGLFERKNLVDQHLQFAFGGNLERQLEIIWRINRVSEDRNQVQIEIFHVERNIAAAVAARGDEPPLKGKRSECFRKCDRIADIIQHDIDPGAIGDAPRLDGEVATAIVDSLIRSQLDGGCDTFVAAGRGDDARAEMLCRLHQGAAQAAGRSHDQDPFAGFDLGAVSQLREGQWAMPPDHRGGDEVERVRNDLHRAGGDLHDIRVGPPGVDAQQSRSTVRLAADDRMADDAIAHLEGFHIRGHGRNFAGRIRPQYMRQRRSPGVLPGAQCDVERLVHSDGANLDGDFSGLERRLRDILQLENTRITELVNDDRLHGCPPPTLQAMSGLSR